MDSGKDDKLDPGRRTPGFLGQLIENTVSFLKEPFAVYSDLMKEPYWFYHYWIKRGDRKLRNPKLTTTPDMYRPGVHIAMWVVIAALIGVGLYFLLIPRLTVPNDSALDGIQIILAIMAGLGAVFLGVYAYRKQRLQEVASARDDQVQFLTRYNAATAQIADDKAAARLAGVYAMTRLANDWPEQRQQCVDVLCAYLRMSPTSDVGDEEVRSTILRVIIERTKYQSHPSSWSDLSFNFDRAEFQDLNMTGTVFYGSEVSFQGAKFRGITQFSHVIFHASVRFDGADFSGPYVSFNFASFGGHNTSFRNTMFTSDVTTFTGSLILGARFDGATFDGVLTTFMASTCDPGRLSFNSTRFRSRYTEFQAANFNCYTTLKGTQFVGTHAIFTQTNFTDSSISFEEVSLQESIMSFDSTLVGFGEDKVGLDRVKLDKNSSIGIEQATL